MLILVAEDNAITAMDIADHLTRCDHRVIGPVATPQAALAAIAQRLPEAALLDFHLRGGTSVPVAAALLEANVPVWFLTGYSDLADLPRALQHVPRLTKPVSIQTLLEILTSVAGRRRRDFPPAGT